MSVNVDLLLARLEGVQKSGAEALERLEAAEALLRDDPRCSREQGARLRRSAS